MELNNTQEYSLSELFSSERRKIIIPDFQRDYCWGDTTHGEHNNTDIVSSFIDTLVEEFSANKNTDVLLGKIDVYEYPKDHIYLTDGQQRLTTLYLLIGMLYKQIKDENLKNCLISEFEENQDDKETYLQYAVRESTLFFVRDLVNEFFIKENTHKVSDIKKQPWYFNEYNLDPSIISMLSALEIIESRKFMDGFAGFVINNIKIQYYDVQDKKHGEERFVIINTTGKSLTVSENVKPILLSNSENSGLAKQWEERETWFWKNKKSDENIADNGVNDFLIWCFQIIDKQDDVGIIKEAKKLVKENKNQMYLEKIQVFFCSLKQLIEYLKEDKFQNQFEFVNDGREVKCLSDFRNLNKGKQQNVLLPLLAFISKFGNDKEGSYQLLRRLRKNYFDLVWGEYRKHNYLDWGYVLQIIEKAGSIEQILQYETNENTIDRIIPLNNWFNEEQKAKLQLFAHRQLIEEWEDHRDFMGDLSFLFQTLLVKNDDTEIPELKNLPHIEIERLQEIYTNYQLTIDLIRSEEKAKENSSLANMFRLFRLFIGCNKVGHIYMTSGDFEGVLFSTLHREHLSKIDFMKLLNSNDLLSYCTAFIKQKVKEQNIFDLTDYNTTKFIKAWLTLKVFYANQNNVLLGFFDGKNETGVAAYRDKNRNRLHSEEFSLANSICGFGVKKGFDRGNCVRYTSDGLWCKPNVIDTPFSDIAFKEDDRKKEQIEANGKTIREIVQIIESSP